jgi:hypothetical protein
MFYPILYHVMALFELVFNLLKMFLVLLCFHLKLLDVMHVDEITLLYMLCLFLSFEKYSKIY